MHPLRRTCIATLTVFMSWTVYAQQTGRPAAEGAGAAVVPRPPVFFHEAWKKPDGPDPRRIMAQEWVSNLSPHQRSELRRVIGTAIERGDALRAGNVTKSVPACLEHETLEGRRTA